jgi:DNA-binding response OmpR family regulator
MKRLLLVEDELALGDTISLSLKKMGFDCTWVKNLKEARATLAQSDFDLLILDRNLPDGEGTALLSHPKRSTFMALILSSKSAVEDRVKGLQLGADDYLPKPFSFKELEARLQALLRRSGNQVRHSHSSELWFMDPNQMTVLTEAGAIELTPLEFKFLKYLIERRETIVSKDRLLKDVWGFSFLPKTRTVDYLITQLRKRIEPDTERPRHLLTIRGAGVKFVP